MKLTYLNIRVVGLSGYARLGDSELTREVSGGNFGRHLDGC